MISITREVMTPEIRSASLVDLAGADGYLFARGTTGLAGRGLAISLNVDEAAEWLAAVEHRDESATSAQRSQIGPVAIGTCDFLPGSQGEVHVPSVVVVDSGGGHRTITATAANEAEAHRLFDRFTPLQPNPPTASNFSVESAIPVEHYLAAVTAARNAVRDGQLEKAVIARPVTVRAASPMDLHSILRRLEATFPTTYRFSIDGFIGASPELLVSVNNEIVRSHPLAGTTRTTGNDEEDAKLAAELLASKKNQIEHKAAIDMVRDSLLPFCSYLDWTPEPSIVKVANVQHLGSLAEGRLSEPRPSVTELVRVLQPTPAVGGHPRDAALELIRQYEGFDRGKYGGAVGWVDAHGNGEWAVSLRCAEFSNDRTSARLIAGGGIVADSEPHAELAETQAKLQAMLGAILRP